MIQNCLFSGRTPRQLIDIKVLPHRQVSPGVASRFDNYRALGEGSVQSQRELAPV